MEKTDLGCSDGALAKLGPVLERTAAFSGVSSMHLVHEGSENELKSGGPHQRRTLSNERRGREGENHLITYILIVFTSLILSHEHIMAEQSTTNIIQ